MAQMGFYYDQTNCAGCKTCQVACKDKNRLEVGTVYREVRSYEIGEFPMVTTYHFSATCNHCEKPACFAICPVKAIEKQADGTVTIDAEMCIGCQSCVTACPYGVPRAIESSGLVGKCDGCLELREAGGVPACVASCPYRCLDFGDLDELAAKYGADLVNALPAWPDGGTGPNTLINPRENAAAEMGAELFL